MPSYAVKRDTPNFAAWDTDTLAKYALEQYLQNLDLREHLEMLRLELKDLRNKQDDWK